MEYLKKVCRESTFEKEVAASEDLKVDNSKAEK